MANIIEDEIYRVSVDSERNFIFVTAKNKNELIHFLADEFAGQREVYGVKRVGKDFSLNTVQVITDPLYISLCAQKLNPEPEQHTSPCSDIPQKKTPLKTQINAAEAKQASQAYHPSEKSVER